MKNTLALLIFLSTFLSNAQVQNYNVGDVVADFTVTDIHGVEYNLYDLTAEGKYIYLDFFFTACVPCQETTPIFNEFFDKYGCNEGDIFCISLNNGNDNNAAVEAFENQYGGPFNHAPAVSNEGGGPAVDSDFGIAAYPTYCLVGPDNKLLVADIWPLSGIETFEGTFPTDFEPEIIDCFLGLLDSENNSDFILYPSISDGNNINIKMNNQVNDVAIHVFDISGKLVYQNNYSNSTIIFDLQVSPGTYFVKVTASTNSTTKKIIIKRN